MRIHIAHLLRVVTGVQLPSPPIYLLQDSCIEENALVGTSVGTCSPMSIVVRGRNRETNLQASSIVWGARDLSERAQRLGRIERFLPARHCRQWAPCFEGSRLCPRRFLAFLRDMSWPFPALAFRLRKLLTFWFGSKFATRRAILCEPRETPGEARIYQRHSNVPNFLA